MWAKEATVAWRFDLEGLEPDWRARSGRVWVSKVNLRAVGAEAEVRRASMAAFLM